MQRQAYDQLYQIEDTFWYHVGRRKLVDVYLGYIQNELGSGLKILDVGSGTGGMFGLLGKYGEVTSLELSEYAARLNKKKYPDATIKIGSANNLLELFPKSSFDLVTFFNVLYHQWISDDAEVLKQTADILRPGGYVILNEPAFKCLYRNNDKFCYGIHRYSQNEISGMLSRAGFSVAKSTYFNSISFFPLLTLTLLQRFGLIRFKGVSSELRPLPWLINQCLKGVMLLERIWIVLIGKIPFGVSILLIAKKDK